MRKVLVTGGQGFLGSALIRRLRREGHEVGAFIRRPESFKVEGVTALVGDLTNQEQVQSAVSQGWDTILHAAAKPGIWGAFDSYYQSNVIATQNLFEAASEHQVKQFIFTGSPSCVFGAKACQGCDETRPYPKKHLNPYSATKAEAESWLLQQDTSVAVCSLRPHLIFGPGDRHLFPRLKQKAKVGSLMQIGDGTNLVDMTYIDDVVEAHILAMEKLSLESPVHQQAYFISQDEPVALWPTIRSIIDTWGLSIPESEISRSMARFIGYGFEQYYSWRQWEQEPPATRFLVDSLSLDHYFSIEKAKQDLGYQPQYTMEQALAKTLSTRF